MDLPEWPDLGVELTELALAKNTYKALRQAWGFPVVRESGPILLKRR